MVIVMNKRKLSVLISFVGIVILIVVGVVIELFKEQKSNEYEIAIGNIETAAMSCVKAKKCRMGKITLDELYDKGFLDKEINPNTNDYFNGKSYITYPELSFYIVD